MQIFFYVPIANRPIWNKRRKKNMRMASRKHDKSGYEVDRWYFKGGSAPVWPCRKFLRSVGK